MKRLIPLISLCLAVAACNSGGSRLIDENVEFASAQIDNEIAVIEAETQEVLNPITTDKDGNVLYRNYHDWRSGFFPGSVWLLYELTGNEKYLPLAKKYTEAIKDVRFVTDNHDVGFISMCSFGNGLRLANVDGYKEVLIQTAESLLTRFREPADLIQSWQSNSKWTCPVIIDNMMNLELLFKVSELTGDKKYYDYAVRHADRTLVEHFRPDGSCWHVVDYNPETGEVRSKVTHQGYSDDSIWSRGHAWAIYGYTMAYRFTGDRRYIDQAIKTFNVMRNHPDMAEGCIPYWDMCAPNIPDEPRDVSCAAIIASALYEISTMDVEKPAQYKEYADRIISTLSSPAYRAELGTNGNFLLMHSVGSFPHGAEVDKPLNYADYYFLEALKRKKEIEK